MVNVWHPEFMPLRFIEQELPSEILLGVHGATGLKNQKLRQLIHLNPEHGYKFGTDGADQFLQYYCTPS